MEYIKPDVSLASALEESDRSIAENKCCISKYKAPLNDGTYSWAFLSIGIADKCTKFSVFDVDKVKQLKDNWSNGRVPCALQTLPWCV